MRAKALDAAGLKKQWKNRVEEMKPLYPRQSWAKRERDMEDEEPFKRVLEAARGALAAIRQQYETNLAIETGRVTFSREMFRRESNETARNIKKTGGKKIVLTAAGETEIHPQTELDLVPAPEGGYIDNPPTHWRSGEVRSIEKSDIAWAMHHLYLKVIPSDAPTPLAWTMLLAGRKNPEKFIAEWAEAALPKKDADIVEKKFEDDCNDQIVDLSTELERMRVAREKP